MLTGETFGLSLGATTELTTGEETRETSSEESTDEEEEEEAKEETTEEEEEEEVAVNEVAEDLLSDCNDKSRLLLLEEKDRRSGCSTGDFASTQVADS